MTTGVSGHSRILGIDPGSRRTGWGVIDSRDDRHQLVAAGVIQAMQSGQDTAFPERLRVIFSELDALIRQWLPTEVAVEQVFMSRNADSALKLGQARGAAICAAVQHDLPVHEYAPRLIKQALVGKGGADKAQVQHMVRVILAIGEPLQEDAADALAAAICHAHSTRTQGILRQQGRAF